MKTFSQGWANIVQCKTCKEEIPKYETYHGECYVCWVLKQDDVRDKRIQKLEERLEKLIKHLRKIIPENSSSDDPWKDYD